MSKPRVIVATHFRRVEEIFEPASFDALEQFADVVWAKDEPMPQHEFEREIEKASAIVFGSWVYGRETLERAGPDLRAVLEVAGGHTHMELGYATCLERGIEVGSCAPAFGPVVAEMALALTLTATRETAIGDRRFRQQREIYLESGNRTATTLYGKTLGFVGCGGLTRSLIPLIRPFRPTLIGYDPYLTCEQMRALDIERVSLENLFDEAQIIYVMAIPTPENKGLISDALMRRLSPTDVLVVASRAHLVDYQCMRDLVAAGRFKAAVDVYPVEPVDANDPIRGVEGIVHSAHRAGALPEALLGIGRMVVADLRSIFQDSPDRQMQYATPAHAAMRGLLDAPQ